jgi:Copper binding periplasmic protein CusF
VATRYPTRLRGQASFDGNKSARSGLSSTVRKNREISMKLAKMILAGAMLAAVPSVALAEQSLTGMISRIDRINGTIVIRQAQSGTVGAGGGGATEQQFNAAGGVLDSVHAGDTITFSASDSGGKKTITKIDKP